MTPSITTVGVIDNHPLFRDGLVTMLADTDDMELAFEVGSIEAMDRELAHGATRPDVVLLDLHLPGGREMFEGVRYVNELGFRTLVVSSRADRPAVLDSFAAGSLGFVSKIADRSEITNAIRAVAAGSHYVSPILADHLLDRHGANWITFTGDQERVLERIARGDSDIEIAEELHRSTRWVRRKLDDIGMLVGERRRWVIARLYIDQTRPPWTDGVPPHPGSPHIRHDR